MEALAGRLIHRLAAPARGSARVIDSVRLTRLISKGFPAMSQGRMRTPAPDGDLS